MSFYFIKKDILNTDKLPLITSSKYNKKGTPLLLVLPIVAIWVFQRLVYQIAVFTLAGQKALWGMAIDLLYYRTTRKQIATGRATLWNYTI